LGQGDSGGHWQRVERRYEQRQSQAGRRASSDPPHRQRLKSVSFSIEGRKYVAIEQNADGPSRWGQLAKEGHTVVQFKDVVRNRFIAVAVDGQVREYGAMTMSSPRLEVKDSQYAVTCSSIAGASRRS